MSSDTEALLDCTDAWGLAAAIRAGATTASKVLEATASRLASRNPLVNAVIEDRIDEARAEVAAGLPDGPLTGVPFVVKALGASIEGMTTTNGSALWRDDIARADSELVRRYRAAGVVLIGLTNSPELGKNASTEPVLHGATRNPHNVGFSPGGSSGGTAAAVAAGIVTAGHANDGGGSIRIPASMCGLVGLKPSRNRVPAAPALTTFGYPVAANHALVKSMRDTALLLDIAEGPMPGDPFVIAPPVRPYVAELGAPVGRLRVALSLVDANGEAVQPECAAAAKQTADQLSDLGHTVVEAGPDYPAEDMRQVSRVVFGVAALVQVRQRLAVLGRELRDDDLEPFTRTMVDAAEDITGLEMAEALQALERVCRTVGAFFEDHDILLTPTLAYPTPKLGWLDTTDVQAMFSRARHYAAMTSPFNATGQPALSLPLGSDANGMPLGSQFVARFGAEDLLIRLGAQLEEAHPWETAPVWPPRG